jgi:putative RecB family exonuclease
VTIFSHSRLSAFENCPRQYRYRYIEKIPVETEGIEAFVGKRVHEILERLYHHVARHRKPPSLGQVLDRFRKDWDVAFHDRIRVVREETTADEYRERGERGLTNYYRSNYPFETGETVGLERALSIQLDESGRYRMRGIVDRIVRRGPGRYEIHDYKTGASLPPRRIFERDRQLALYQIGLEQTFDDVEEVELVWHYLTFNRTFTQTRSPEQLTELRTGTIALIDTIESATEHPPRTGPLCRWCDYNEICDAGRDAARRGAPDARATDLAANADGGALPDRGAAAGDASLAATQLSWLD